MDSIIWRRLDTPGHETARVWRDGDEWHLAGAAVFVHESRACRVAYDVSCDAEWRTRRTTIDAWIGNESNHVELVSAGGHWTMNGTPMPNVDGCIDVDLGFTPSTNLLPIRRLNLEVGQATSVRAAWVHFPDLTLHVLEQVYRRTGERLYRYESDGGRFTADLQVDDVGLVTDYQNLWVVER
jgi:uncharacterized protein